MKNIFTSDFWGQIIITVFLLGIVIFFIQKHFENKWTVNVAQEVLRKENFTNNKRDAYLDAIGIAIRHISYSYSAIPNSKPIGTPPTQLEMNSCMVRLYIYSTGDKIARQFKKILLPLEKGEDIVIEATKLFTLIGRDLGNDNINIDFKEFQFIYPSFKDTTKL